MHKKLPCSNIKEQRQTNLVPEDNGEVSLAFAAFDYGLTRFKVVDMTREIHSAAPNLP